MKEIDRRAFFARTFGTAAGLALLAVPRGKAGLRAAQEARPGAVPEAEWEALIKKYQAIHGTCSQTSFAALNERFGLEADQAIPALMPFAGGIAGKGETCGAVTGSVLAIGFFLDAMARRGKVPAAPAQRYARAFLADFEKEFGSTRCREIVKRQFGRYFDLQDPDDQRAFMAESRKDPKCVEVMTKAVLIAGRAMAEA
ncbi:MAG TPA: C-GCAxxG-C-C family protein [Candidatus Aminicenantes bacterium]|nr:C-GCAxxG-C-C family protein [Candidatus Aminicenantes bacterium]